MYILGIEPNIAFQKYTIFYVLATHQELCYIHEMLLVAQSCLILCDPMDCTCKGPLSMEFSQARVLKWVASS